MRQRINDGKVIHVVKILEYETDLDGSRPPYSRSRVTKLHGRNVKSYELDVACSKLGLQTEDYKWYKSISKKSELLL